MHRTAAPFPHRLFHPQRPRPRRRLRSPSRRPHRRPSQLTVAAVWAVWAVAVAAVVSTVAVADASPVAAFTVPPGHGADVAAVVEAAAAVRADVGRGPLTRSVELDRLAGDVAAGLASAGSLAHTAELRIRLDATVPGWASAGENVGVGPTVRAVTDAFASSPAHRANIVGDFTHIGVGVVSDGTRRWVAVLFAALPGRAAAETVGLVELLWFRPPTPAETAAVTAVAARVGSAAVAAWMAAADRHIVPARFAAALYELTARPPDRDGFRFWAGQLAAGVPAETVAARFAASPELASVHGTDLVDLVYRRLLHRPADPAGAGFWAAQPAGRFITAVIWSVERAARTS